MTRTRLTLILPAFGLLFACGCVPKDKPTPTPSAQQTASAPLVDPAEKDREPAELLQPIEWQAQGTDTAGRNFSGYLVVDGSPENYLRAGYFQWHAEVGGGRYHFEGTYDPTSRTVRWTGFTILDRVGMPCNAVYTAVLSADGRRFENGKWSGGISVPGVWTAMRVGE